MMKQAPDWVRTIDLVIRSVEYMHMTLVGVRDGFISAQVSESSTSLKVLR